MASIVPGVEEKRHVPRRFYFSLNGRRHAVRWGPLNKDDASTVLNRIKDLVHAKMSGGSPKDATSTWLKEIDDKYHKRLAAAGLIDERVSARLGAFLDDYLTSRTDCKEGTRLNLIQAKDTLVDFFGKDKLLREITPREAAKWRISLRRRIRSKRGKSKKAPLPLMENTRCRYTKDAKSFFNAAVDARLIEENPFKGLPSTVKSNPEREYIVTPEETERVLEACPDAQWRTLVALCRYAGMRSPSETMNLRWQDINWATGRIRFRTKKTEHHVGKATREIPIFAELLPYLQDAFEIAKPGTEHVITMYRKLDQPETKYKNLGTQFKKILERAGIEPWQRPFQNLRRTRVNELKRRFPSHVVDYWMGHDADTSRRHYMQVMPEDYDLAISGGALSGARKLAQAGAESTQLDAEPLETMHSGAQPCASAIPPGLLSAC